MRKGNVSSQTTGYSARRSEEHTSELQSQSNLVCRLLLEKKKRCARVHPYPISPLPPHPAPSRPIDAYYSARDRRPRRHEPMPLLIPTAAPIAPLTLHIYR